MAVRPNVSETSTEHAQFMVNFFQRLTTALPCSFCVPSLVSLDNFSPDFQSDTNKIQNQRPTTKNTPDVKMTMFA